MSKLNNTQGLYALWRPYLYILCSILIFNAPAIAEVQEFNSGQLPVQLIELYTSEGCSSCPNADKFLSSLRDTPELWQTYVPVAFHVDYWNKLGWEDRFSSSRYSRRQRTHRSQGNINAVYTPGFVVSGEEWKGWFSRRPLPQNSSDIVGNLNFRIKNGNSYIARFDRTDKSRKPLQLTIALLGMDLQTHVKRGENSGRLLQHDFVVLDITEEVSNDTLWQGKLPNIPKGENTAFAAWVSEVDNLKPIQTVGGYLN